MTEPGSRTTTVDTGFDEEKRKVRSWRHDVRRIEDVDVERDAVRANPPLGGAGGAGACVVAARAMPRCVVFFFSLSFSDLRRRFITSYWVGLGRAGSRTAGRERK